MKKKCLADAECPLSRAYDAIGDWWSLLVVTQVLINGKRRFSEIQECLGMAKNILTARLQKLVEQGILRKEPASDGSNYQEYVPTERGRDLCTVIVAMRQWGERHFFETGGCSYALVDRAKQEPIPDLAVRSADGRLLSPEELESVKRCPDPA